MHLTYRWQVALVLVLGLLMATIDTTVVSVVLPQMATALQADYQTITWVGTGYFLATAAIIPIAGYISDRIGSKTAFLISLGLFTLGSALCAIAPNYQLLIAFRVFQGIGGGAMMPIAMATLFRLFAPTERAGAMVLLMVPLLLGPAFGPLLGGYLATSFTWNAIFTINLPIGVVVFILALLILRGKAAEHEAAGSESSAQRFDLLGLVLSMAGFTAFVYGISRAGADGWGNAIVVGFLVIGGVLLIALIIVELLVNDPVIDLRLFRNSTFTMANILLWATNAVLFGSLFLLPLFFERVEGLSALITGEIVIFQGLASAVGTMISGKLYNKIGPRILAVFGTALVTISLVGFTHLEVTTTGADLQIWMILRGLGLGMVMQPVQMLALSVVSNKLMAKASSLINSTRVAFGAVGVAVLTTYLTQHATSHATAIAAGFATHPRSSVAATCVAQFGQHVQALHACAAQHALTMGLNDTFLFALIGCALCTVLALFVGRDPAIEAAKAAKKRGEAAVPPDVPTQAIPEAQTTNP
jgi:EmrB/QacA subfamily drug resistance transporter